MGEPEENCLKAIKAISKAEGIRLISVSSLYLTSPVSDIPQRDFINCAVRIGCEHTANGLLRILNEIEEQMGRNRGLKTGPRIIDLDILLFGAYLIATPLLNIPHPELHRRRFAIIPCIEIEPNLYHPFFRRPLRSFLSDIDDNDQRVIMLGMRVDVLQGFVRRDP
jgi:2-amino-4-hydroxy-6-hydroxymethyldihydropteridine diphosphokinase